MAGAEKSARHSQLHFLRRVEPAFAALLFGTTAMDFWLGRQMSKASDQHARRRWLVASVCMNLSMLGFFKYGNFLLQNFQWLLARVGIIYQPPHLDILLPVGIKMSR